MKRALWILILMLIVPVSVVAQEEEPPPKPWSGVAEISYVATSGNTDTSTLGTSGELHYTRELWTGDLKAAYVEAESEGELRARTITALAGATRKLREDLGAFGRLGFLQNEFAGIDRQLSAEAGASWSVLEGEIHLLALELGGGFVSEDRIDAADRDFATASAGAKYRWKFSANGELAEEAVLRHNVEDSDDWRFVNVASISAGLNSILSLKLSHTLQYSNEPVPGFDKTDTTTAAALVAKF